MYYANEVMEQLNKSEHIVIYGARIVAKEVANCLLGKPYCLRIDSFMVSSKLGNPDSIMGIPVIEIKEGKKIFQDALILVATMEKYQKEIEETLQENGFHKIILLGFESDLWSELRGNYFRELQLSNNEEYLTFEDEISLVKEYDLHSSKDVHIYMAKSHLDKKLSVDCEKYDCEIPIQVGSILTEQRICDVCDDKGDNISSKNREYCELTALYWIWKNDHSKYAGLCHYRRHFRLDKAMCAKLVNSDIDVILTIPILNFPNVRSAYVHDHIESDWNVMMDAIKKLHSEYIGTAQDFQNGNFYYAYNMFITRKEIFDDYCAWLFPILLYCEQNCVKKENKYQNRYIGFLAERLLSIYFLHNKDSYKIVHIQKEFLS